ncbi:MAG: aldo/keto reductase [Gemmatimonadota bacterium]
MSLTRRELLRLGGGAGLYVVLRPRPVRGPPGPGDAGTDLASTGDPRATPHLGPTVPRSPSRAPELRTREIPSSGETIPVVGIGTRNYRVEPGGDLTPYRETLRSFAELGGTVLDTAPSYGNSESVLGELLAELGIRDRIFLATKVDQQGREAGLQRMEESFRKLRTDHVELMQVHNLRDAVTQLETLREWKAGGRLRYVGLTTSSRRQHGELLQLMEAEEPDFIQVNYSLGDRGAAERILPLAAERGIAVLVNLPFGRARLFRAVGDRPLPGWAAEFDCESWGQFFLKYILADPGVTCVIPGTTKPHHAVDNLGAARGRLPDDALRRRMEEFFDGLGSG